MRKEAKLFLAMLIFLGLSFLLCGYSLVMCFVYGMDGDAIGTSILEIAYLFLHLVAVAILFYLFFRAMKFESFFVRGLMVDQNGVRYVKKQAIFAVFAFLFLLLSIYATLEVFGANLPLYDFFGMTIWHDLMNAGYLITALFLLFFLYPFFYEHNEKE